MAFSDESMFDVDLLPEDDDDLSWMYAQAFSYDSAALVSSGLHVGHEGPVLEEEDDYFWLRADVFQGDTVASAPATNAPFNPVSGVNTFSGSRSLIVPKFGSFVRPRTIR